MDETPPPSRAWEVFQAFLIQGLTAFGGLLALAQFLPGPASSQLGMAIGLRRAGYLGLAAAWLGFTLPAGAAMIGLAYAAPQLTAVWGGGYLHGLQIAAA